MRIVIIGGGISGLSFYLWLQKLNLTTPHTITIYEARHSTTATATPTSLADPLTSNSTSIGGVLGFSPVGLRVLRRLDPQLEQEILAKGHWMGRWRMSNARGWVLGETEVVESGGGVLIGREVFWQCLRRRVPDGVVLGGKKVVEVLACDETISGKCEIVFEDGARVIDSVYPTFTTPDLAAWANCGCVLVGDAAHALPPSSGLGASMALEDCETLAMLLAHHQYQGQDGWHLAAKLYSDMRIPRLRWIRKEAEKIGTLKEYMGVLQEMLMYLFIWLSCKIGLFARHDRKLSEYDVPAEVRKVLTK